MVARLQLYSSTMSAIVYNQAARGDAQHSYRDFAVLDAVPVSIHGFPNS